MLRIARAINVCAAFCEILLSRILVQSRTAPILRPEPRTIALFGYMGLGDAIMFLPALRAIRAAFPTAKIHCILSRNNSAYEVFKGSGCVDEMHFYEFKRESVVARWRVNARLRRQHFDVIVCSQTAPIEHFVPLLASVPVRVGHVISWHKPWKPRPNWLFNFPVPLDPNDKAHESERYLRLARALGIASEHNDEQDNEQDNEQDDKHEAQHHYSPERVNGRTFAFLPEEPLGAAFTVTDGVRVVGIHAVTSAMQDWKNWGKERFIALCRRLLAEPSTRIILFGEERERPQMEQMRGRILEGNAPPKEVLSAVPDDAVFIFTPNPHDDTRTGLEQTAAMLRLCSVLVGNDSGVAHLAVSCGVPVVRLFGMTDYFGFRALDTTLHTDVWKALPCSPCVKLGTVQAGLNLTNCGHRNCLASISVEEVALAAEKIIHSHL